VKLTHELLSCATSSIITQTSVNPSPKEEPLDIYRSILIENLIELNELKWPKSDICSLRNRFTSPVISHNISSLKTALLIIETIVTNEISSQAHIDRIVRRVIESPADLWMNELNKIVDERGKAKSVDILLEELASENPSLNIKRLRKQYERVMDYYKNEISSWTTTDLEQNYQCNDEHKKVAIIVQAAHLYKQYRPRDIQILSLLLLIDKPENGRLAQIRTGEGKSIIVSMCEFIDFLQIISFIFSSIVAVYLSLPPLNKHVDIITTSEILAQRDADEFAPFYRMFGLSVDHNCYEPSVTPNYNVNIVYGTVVQFAGDLLRTDFYLQTEIRGNRPYDAAIVDEVDSMFIDQRQHYTQLASLTPGYKTLNIVLRFIYSYFQKYNITENNEFVIRQANGFSKGNKKQNRSIIRRF
jgi:preprotein translocase subunit SecA